MPSKKEELTRTIRRACRVAKVKEIEEKCNETNQLECLNDTRTIYLKAKEVAKNSGKGIEDKYGKIMIRMKKY